MTLTPLDVTPGSTLTPFSTPHLRRLPRELQKFFRFGTSKMTNMTQATQTAAQTFQDKFAEITLTVAKPMFDEFSFDATANGYPAIVEESRDNNGDPFISIRFILDRNAILGEYPENECLFVLKGILAEKQFEVSAAYDQRPGKNGLLYEKLETRMANHTIIEDRLTKFLEAAMASRKPPVAPKPLVSPIIWKARN